MKANFDKTLQITILDDLPGGIPPQKNEKIHDIDGQHSEILTSDLKTQLQNSYLIYRVNVFQKRANFEKKPAKKPTRRLIRGVTPPQQ